MRPLPCRRAMPPRPAGRGAEEAAGPSRAAEQAYRMNDEQMLVVPRGPSGAPRRADRSGSVHEAEGMSA